MNWKMLLLILLAGVTVNVLFVEGMGPPDVQYERALRKVQQAKDQAAVEMACPWSARHYRCSICHQ